MLVSASSTRGFSSRLHLLTCLFCWVSFAAPCWAFEFPGVSPASYKRGDTVEIQVNSLTSTRTELPYDFYSLPWCKPERIARATENIGEIIAGHRIYNSLYEIRALQDRNCAVWCDADFDEKHIQQFARLVSEDYRVNWVVDELPAVTREGDRFEFGFPLGQITRGTDKELKTYINNHVHITIRYHTDETSFEGLHIVGVEVTPSSVQHSRGDGGELLSCDESQGISFQSSDVMPLLDSPSRIIFTYDVHWELSETSWGDRWEVYTHTTDADVHWFSIVNSLMIVLLLTGMIAIIMARILRRDIARYTDEKRDPDVDETGWKLLSSDVFRAPNHSMFLSILIGTGIQLIVVLFVVMLLATYGILSPVAYRGGLLTVTLTLMVLASVVSGYYSARFMKLFLGDEWVDSVPVSASKPAAWNPLWKTCTLRTALFFPTVVGLPCLILNFVASHEGSSIAIPAVNMGSIMFAWVCVCTPLVYLGSYFGFKKRTIEIPCKPHEIPRFIIHDTNTHLTSIFGSCLCNNFIQQQILQPVTYMLIGGLLPFGTVFIELFFILSSVWLHQPYHVFGFLLIVFVILMITCAEISVVLCYFQLCSLDYQWWWRSFYSPGASSVYLFAYCTFYFHSKLELVRTSSTVMFFGYSFVVCFAFGVVTGTIGLLAAFVFVRFIYHAARTS